MEKKNILKSKTIYGVLLILAPIISKYLGFDVSEDLHELVEIAIQAIGGGFAVYGRIKAKHELVVKN